MGVWGGGGSREMAGCHVERHPERVWLLLVLILTEIEERRVVPSRRVSDGEWLSHFIAHFRGGQLSGTEFASESSHDSLAEWSKALASGANP